MKPKLTTDGIWHGGDYNPEQWPREVWDEDARLMDLAHWNVATLGVFSWVTLEPEEGRFEFGWLDELMDRMASQGRKVVLATPTAATPAWLDRAYPEVLRTDADGTRRRHGNRVNYCLTSPVYRTKSREVATRLAQRYAEHPALALWHVSNEYGGACHCALCEGAFRQWLREKFGGDLDALNAAYWTRFWSHTYTDWDQIEIPGGPYGETSIHGLTLDWRRFVTDQSISLFENEATILRSWTPSVPITTNFMGFYQGLDYAKFAAHVDVASWDSYPRFVGPLTEPNTWIAAAMTHDLMRSLKRDRPFLLMECTPSASNWYPVMELKSPEMHRLEGLQAVAHGSDSVQYFQWRQSRGSQEKFHGAVVQHDGSEHARVFRDVASLGQTLRSLAPVAGSVVQPEVALIYDWEVSWAIDAACGPLVGDRGYIATCRDHYTPFWEAGISVDVVSSEASLDPYRLVVAPMLYMLKPGVAEALKAFVRGGGTLVGTYWTGIADENDLCFLGGFPGPLRELFGVWAEEIDALAPSTTRWIEAEGLGLSGPYEARTFCELIHAEGAETLARYGSGFYAGRPALTRKSFGEGEAYYVASRNDAAFNRDFLGALGRKLGLCRAVEAELPPGVTAQRRGGALFLLNCTPDRQTVSLAEGEWIDAESSEPALEVALEPFGSRVFFRA